MGVHGHVCTAAQRRRANVARVCRLWLSLVAVSCSFDTQPIFDAHLGADQLADVSVGGRQAASPADEGAPAVTSQTTDTVTLDRMACTPGETSCRDANTLSICAADGQSSSKQTCVGGCNERAAGPACNVCSPGELLGCAGSGTVRRCKSDGTGTDTVMCPNGCSAGTCSGTCVPGTTDCADDNTLRTCDAQGVHVTQGCAQGCSAAQSGAACNACPANTTACEGQDSVACDVHGQLASRTPCVHGCEAATGQCMPVQLMPSNLPADTCAAQAADDLEVTGVTTLNTDTGCSNVVRQSAGAPEICVVRHRDIHVLVGATLKASGGRALALVATRDLSIEGVLSVAAHAAVAGPGALASGAGVGQDAVVVGSPGSGGPGSGGPGSGGMDAPANVAGGGAGHAVKGGAGGAVSNGCNGNGCSQPGGAGGMPYGSEHLVPLQGGSRGGHNSGAAMSGRRATPGAGGGALQLVSCADLSLGAQAIVDASGGGGGGGLPGPNDNNPAGAGAGGGSGGAILIEAMRVSVHAGAVVVANGGGGGGGATPSRTISTGTGMGMGNQTITLPGAAGLAGQDGQRSAVAAAGGTAGGPGSLAGAAGGTSGAAASGGGAVLPPGAAGGGGAAAGFIRINTMSGTANLSGTVLSPHATTGTAGAG
jgi:hypothetical protein